MCDMVVPVPGAPGAGKAVGGDSAAVGQGVGRILLREDGHARVEAERPREREVPVLVVALPRHPATWSHTRHNFVMTAHAHAHAHAEREREYGR